MLRPVTVPCPRCGNPVILRVSDQHTVVNGPYVSLMVLQHPTHTTCGTCGLVSSPAISAVKNMDVIAQPVPEREQEQRIVVPNAPVSPRL